MKLEDYYRALRAADWTYGYSDSAEVYRRGRDEISRLRFQAGLSPQHRALFDAMQTAGEAGTAWPAMNSIVENLPTIVDAPALPA